MIGFDKQLFFLPFDHRSTFVKGIFPDKQTLHDGELDQIRRLKQIIYEGLKKAVQKEIPKEDAALLVDEQFGSLILEDASREGFITAVTVEKSGQEEFDFEYGSEYQEHLLKFSPTFAKALVRFNPEGDADTNSRQLIRLKELSDFCHSNDMKLLIEPLINGTEQQLSQVDDDQKRFDREIRPDLEVRMIRQFQDAGVETDVWKIEGFDQPEHYQQVVTQARSNGRDTVGVIVLGRGGDEHMVASWLTAGCQTEGIIGFAIGRTIFWEPITEFAKGRIDGYQAAEQISTNFIHFYRIFNQAA